MAAHLSRGKLNIGLLREQAQREFLDLLDKCDGTKIIIWDDGLSGPFGLICEYALLKQRDVLKVYALQPGRLDSVEADNIIFITRPLLKLIDHVVENVHTEESRRRKETKKKWHIFFVPMRSLLCIELLKSRGVYGSFTMVEEISSCCVYPLDSDLLSMEIEDCFKDLYVDKDPTCLYQIAKTVMMIQDLYGPIKQISGKGDYASKVWKLMIKLGKEPQNSKSIPRKSIGRSQIDQLLLLDRNVDFVSPFATQLTYEGLVDEFYGINNCTAKFPSERFATQHDFTKTISEKKLVIFNSADDLFAEIRDKSFGAVGSVLSKKVKQISMQADRKQKKTVQEMKQIVEQLPQTLDLKRHLGIHMPIAEMIKEKTDSEEFVDGLHIEQEILLGIDTDRVHPYIEDAMTKKEDLIKVLRLICIQCAVNSGLKLRTIEQYKRDIVQTYGYQHILTLNNLEKAGLLKVQQNTRGFTVLKKTLKLIVEEGDDASPRDINYVHSIYAPLSVRLVQHYVKYGGWRNLADVISLISGALIDHSNQCSSTSSPMQRRSSLSSQTDAPKVVLVFFIGGCTFAEISALRFLSQQEDLNVEFVIATTKIINGNTVIRSLMERI